MDTTKHDQAIGLTEEALDKLVQGDEAASEKLIEKAKKLDETAPDEVLHDLDEDASDRDSSHGATSDK